MEQLQATVQAQDKELLAGRSALLAARRAVHEKGAAVSAAKQELWDMKQRMAHQSALLDAVAHDIAHVRVCRRVASRPALVPVCRLFRACTCGRLRHQHDVLPCLVAGLADRCCSSLTSPSGRVARRWPSRPWSSCRSSTAPSAAAACAPACRWRPKWRPTLLLPSARPSSWQANCRR